MVPYVQVSDRIVVLRISAMSGPVIVHVHWQHIVQKPVFLGFEQTRLVLRRGLDPRQFD